MYQENQYFVKNMLLLKNPQFLPNHYEILWICGTHEYLIFTKFRNDWVKIVDFLIKAYFWQMLWSATFMIIWMFETILFLFRTKMLVMGQLLLYRTKILLFCTNQQARKMQWPDLYLHHKCTTLKSFKCFKDVVLLGCFRI